MRVVDSMMFTISKAPGCFLRGSFWEQFFDYSLVILGVILGTSLGPDWPKKAPRRVKESYMARFVTMTLLRPCRLSSWLFLGTLELLKGFNLQETPSSTMIVAQPWQLYTCLIIFCGVQGHQPRCTIRLLPPCSRSSATLISLKAGLDLGGS